MGNWNLTIAGVGSHHSGSAADVEQMAAKFADELKAAGHSVTRAHVTTTGGEIDVLNRRGELLPIGHHHAVIVNGRSVDLGERAYYRNVVEAAGFDSERDLTVTFSRGPSGPSIPREFREGTLARYGSTVPWVPTAPGMVFNVTDTSAA